MTTKRFIAISNCWLDCDCYPIDTDEQIKVAQQAMRELDLYDSFIHVGDPDCPDSYRTNLTLRASDQDPLTELWDNAESLTEEEQKELDRRLHNPWTVTQE